MVASTSADPSSSRRNDTAFAVGRSGIGKTLAFLIARGLTGRRSRHSGRGAACRSRAAVPARTRCACRRAIARACARRTAFVAVDGFDDPRPIRWNIRIVGIAWPGGCCLHGDIRRLRIAARCRDQSGSLKVVGERVVESDSGGAAGDPQGGDDGRDHKGAFEGDARTFQRTQHRTHWPPRIWP
jgi:hypothetical protein